MAEAVLDASALLAWLADERGADEVGRVLESGTVLMSGANLAEVLTKLENRGAPEAEVRRIRYSLDIDVRALDEDAAWRIARLHAPTRPQGLSLGDRACLALALSEALPAVTADRAWADIDLGVEIRLIR